MNFGAFYPLILIPIGLVGASNVINLLGGFNGCETGMGIVYISTLAIYAFLHQSVAGPILLITAASLAGFIKYNWYPARILPGDSLTYLLGAVVAASVIVGNMERAGVIILTPFIIEFFLKARARFKASSLGKLGRDGKLDPPYGKRIYSLTHILMNMGHWSEIQITLWLILIQTFFAALIFIV
jgi:UDP-N-acetylglucosamine--dolichyl-phosphate N-acetylglucosaminephosphotransferase